MSLRLLLILLVVSLVGGCTPPTSTSTPTNSPTPLSSPVPEWAHPMTADQFRGFIQAVKTQLDKRGYTYTIRGDEIRYGDQQRAYLHNLAQICASNETAEWPAIIEGHFARLETASKTLPKKFTEIKDRILLRVISEETYQGMIELTGQTLVSRSDLPGTRTVVVVDFPETISYVDEEQAQKWEKSHDELFQLGMRHLGEQKLPPVQPIALGGDESSGHLQTLSEESHFVATQVLRLSKLPGMTGPKGTLVALPTRHFLITFPIKDDAVILALQKLPAIADGLFQEGPGGTTPDIFFHDGERFHAVPYGLDGERTRVEPPEALLKVLEEVASP